MTSWVRDLGAPPEVLADAACEPERVARAVAELGQRPAAWGIDFGRRQFLRIEEEFAELVVDERQVGAMRRATESVGLALVLCLAKEDPSTAEQIEVRDVVREAVRHRVSLERLEKIVRTGHLWWSARVMEECVAHVPLQEQPAELFRSSQLVLAFMNGIVDEIRARHAIEETAWGTGTGWRARELVQSVLDDPTASQEDTGRRLGHQIGLRHHLGAVVWGHGVDDSDLLVAARDVLQGWGAQQVLTVPFEPGVLWAWGGSPSPFEAPETDSAPAPGVRVALGTPGYGAPGFAESHRNAEQVRVVTARAPGLTSPVVRHHDAAVLGVVLKDLDCARIASRFELVDLAAEGAGMDDLRRTLAAYLELRSPQAVANRLFVSRSTVAYRLRQIEALLGHPIAERPWELWTALRIHQATSTGT